MRSRSNLLRCHTLLALVWLGCGTPRQIESLCLSAADCRASERCESGFCITSQADGSIIVDASSSQSFECAPFTGDTSIGALVLATGNSVGFRFEIVSASQSVSMGLNVTSSGSSQTLTAGLVRLSGPSDAPDTANLTGADVVGTTLLTAIPDGAAHTISGPIDRTLAPGWYAAVYSADVAGFTGAVDVQSRAGTCTLPGSGPPFSQRHSDGLFGLAGASPYLFVVVR